MRSWFLIFVAWSAGLKLPLAMRLHIAVGIRMVRRHKENAECLRPTRRRGTEKRKQRARSGRFFRNARLKSGARIQQIFERDYSGWREERTKSRRTVTFGP